MIVLTEVSIEIDFFGRVNQPERARDSVVEKRAQRNSLIAKSDDKIKRLLMLEG